MKELDIDTGTWTVKRKGGDPFPPGTVIHLTEGYTMPDGSNRITVLNWTNDNEDRGYTGYPGCHADWITVIWSPEAFKKRYGTSRIGCLGARVIVRLDEKEVQE